MSENTENVTTTNDAPKPTKAKAKASRVKMSVVIAQYAKARKISTDRAGKDVRKFARANFATISKLDPAYFGARGKHKTVANDGRPWEDVNARTAKYILTRGKTS
jgi:hypothetical protein